MSNYVSGGSRDEESSFNVSTQLCVAGNQTQGPSARQVVLLCTFKMGTTVLESAN